MIQRQCHNCECTLKDNELNTCSKCLEIEECLNRVKVLARAKRRDYALARSLERIDQEPRLPHAD